jgi:rhodanese-related sulfurtransferase
LDGGFERKKQKEIDTIDNRICFAEEVKIGESKVIDIRKDSEYSAEHVEDAFSKPLAGLDQRYRS